MAPYNYHEWRAYRDANYNVNAPITAAQIQAIANVPFPAQVPFNYQAPPLSPRQKRKWGGLEAHELDADSIAFLDEHKADLPGNVHRWDAVRLLGSGGEGRAGLWQYKRPRKNDPVVDAPKIVVKEVSVGELGRYLDMDAENSFLYRLSLVPGQHVVRRIGPTHRIGINDPSVAIRERIDPNIPMYMQKAALASRIGTVGRIFLEYCELGDLRRLLSWRDNNVKFFNELSLWRIFKCLVEGCMLLTSGSEIPALGAPGPPTLAQVQILDPPENWASIVHFDLKPANILMTADATHATTPLMKIADLGLSVLHNDQPVGTQRTHQDRAYRYRGTHGYFAPEQFAEEWDYQDWQNSPVAGNYGSRTNVWGIGVIMYQLVTLDEQECPDPKRPWYHPGNINGLPARGKLYAPDLTHYIVQPGPQPANPAPPNTVHAQRYSRTLIDTIWECLYHSPLHRVDLAMLDTMVDLGLQVATTAAINANAPLSEDFKGFKPPAARKKVKRGAKNRRRR